MNILLFGKRAAVLKGILATHDITIVEHDPDIIITYGGDGTLLAAESQYPTIPKLPLRDSLICKKCHIHTDQETILHLAAGDLKKAQFSKITASCAGKNITALNDIVIRNILPMHAIRFVIEDTTASHNTPVIIGDGIVATTPFGSTGYYHSITRQPITSGYGIAFNNSTVSMPPLLFDSPNQILFRLIRGPASLSYDNANNVITLNEDDTVTISSAPEVATVLGYEALRCSTCKIDRTKRNI